jgi:hypothetical protein
MAKWDLSKLPEGRKPLPDEWFRERAQMQERIEELEDKLAKAVTGLQHYSCRCVIPCEDLNGSCGDVARDTLAELKGETNE